MTQVITTVSDLQRISASKKVGAVFTMGALHAGHEQLIKKCRENIGDDALLVVTIFVNPKQFNDQNDYAKYPKDLTRDIEICKQNSVDIVFAPEVSEIYPPNKAVTEIDPGNIADVLEGASRPGHFVGMATVVNRLLEITKPEVTCFGEKDFQQLAIVKNMVSKLNIPTKVIGVPTVRESDGLALSSRNVRLTAKGRELAPKLFEAMKLVKTKLAENNSLDFSLDFAKQWLAQFPEIELDYLVVTNSQLEKPTPGLARVLIAAKIGDVRLIDNMECELVAQNV